LTQNAKTALSGFPKENLGFRMKIGVKRENFFVCIWLFPSKCLKASRRRKEMYKPQKTSMFLKNI